MNNTVNITDFRNNIGTYIDKVIYNKEAFLIKKGKSIVAEVIAYDEKKKSRGRKEGLRKLVGLWKDIDWKKYRKAIETIEMEDRKDVADLS